MFAVSACVSVCFNYHPLTHTQVKPLRPEPLASDFSQNAQIWEQMFFCVEGNESPVVHSINLGEKYTL